MKRKLCKNSFIANMSYRYLVERAIDDNDYLENNINLLDITFKMNEEYFLGNMSEKTNQYKIFITYYLTYLVLTE